MSDHVTLVENIRAFLARIDQVSTPELVQLAEQYSAASRAANDRLLRCGDFLRRGLRTEAIHVAETEPKLLDMVAVLDFIEFPQWELICTTYGLPIPNAINIDLAAQVNEAYSQELPLQGLLSKHRLLALSLAPMRVRIATLRAISAADPGTQAWADDLQTYETHRVRQIAAEAREAVEGADLLKLEELGKELSGPWVVEDARQLKQQVGAMVGRLRQKDVVSQLRGLMPQVQAAHAAMDLPGLKQVLATWDELAKSAPSGVPKELHGEVSEAIAWVKGESTRISREHEYEAACLRLEDAIERDAPDSEMVELRSQATRLGESLPIGLEQRYATVRETRQLIVERRRRRNTIIAAVVVLVVSGVSIWFVNETLKDREATRWASAIRGDVQAQRIEAASAKLVEVTKAEPRLMSRSSLALAAQEFEAAKRTDEKRAAEFSTALSKSVGEDLSLPNAEALAEARRLARTDEERARVQQATSAIASAQAVAQSQRDAAFAAAVKDLQTRVAQLGVKGESAASNGALSEIEREADELSRQRGVSAVVASTLTPVVSRLKEIRSEEAAVASKGVEQRLEASVLDAVRGATSVSALKVAMERFVRSTPESPRSVEFKKVLAFAPQLEALVEWGEIHPGRDGAMPLRANEVGPRLEAARAYLNRRKDSPLEPQIKAYVAFLERADSVLGSEGNTRQTLTRVFGLELLSQVKTVRLKSGEVYYMLMDAAYTDGEFSQFRGLVSGDVKQTKTVIKRKDAIAQGPTPAPQVAWVTRAEEQLAATTPLDADALPFVLASEAVMIKEMDPIIKAILYQKMVKLGQQGGVSLEPRVSDFLKKLEDFNPDQYPWMNPEHEAASEARSAAARLMTQAPSLASQIEAVSKRSASVVAAAEWRLQAISVGLRNSDGKWDIAVPSSAREGTRAMAIVLLPGGNPELVELGKVKAGRLDGVPKHLALLPEGSPVFFVGEVK